MKFNKILIMTALSLLTMQSFAQTPLASLRKMFSSTVSIECDYETEFRNTPVTGHSELVVQGDMYVMTGNGLQVYCNGGTLWTVDESSREVVIEPCSAQSKDYMSNPALLLSDIDKLFKVKSTKSLGSGKEQCVLEAIVKCGVTKAELVLTTDGKVVSGKFILEDGQSLTVKVTSMKKTEEKQKSFFSPQRKFGSDWIVTDLR